jgi:hypothetical protein
MQTIYAILGEFPEVMPMARHYAIFLVAQMGDFDTLASQLTYPEMNFPKICPLLLEDL